MSVYQLIKELCSTLIKESDNEGCDLATAKRIAFETLLKNSQNSNEGKLSLEKLVEDFQFSSFELMLVNRRDDAAKVDTYVEKIKEHEQLLLPISSLLLNLKDFSDTSSGGNSGDNFFQLQTSTLQSTKKNAYMPQLSLNKVMDTSNKKNNGTNFFTSILDAYVGNDRNRSIENNKLKQLPAPAIVADECSLNYSIKSSSTWENLEETQDLTLKNFSSESSTSIYHHLKSLAISRGTSEFNSVTLPKLINDIKLLIIGIESESFKRAEDTLKFYTTINWSCEDISDLSHFLDSFLEAGSCFKRLKTYTSKNPFNQCQIFDGFLFKAFCDRVVKFLNHCRDLIYSQEAESLLKLHESTAKLRNIITHLARFLNIHPSCSVSQISIPTGSDFLRLLYDEYTKVFNSDLKCFYIQLLKSCCEVYYLRYQLWFFHGQLDDPHKELFIYYVDHYTENTKQYFDKAYLIRKHSVPGFLHGCAENVLLCGKYTMLLRSFKPMHPLFRLKKPSLKVCLTFDDIKDLKSECEEFMRVAREECGEVISIEAILNERKNVKMEKYKNAETAAVRNMQKWKVYQEERLLLLKEHREMQQQGLRKKLQYIEEKKLEKRLEEIAAEREYLDQAEEIERQELERENLEIRERIKIYQELNEKMDKSNESREKIVERLKSRLSSEDILNANEKVDEPEFIKDDMNNIIEKAKVLSEAQKNKIKVLSHEYNFPTPSTSDINANNEIATSKLLTEAQRNKLKVMGHDLGTLEKEECRPQIKIQDYDKMTDLQRNRMKVLAHEFETIEKEEKVVQNVLERPMTDLQKNRMKVLSHEFAYFDEAPSKKLTLELPETPLEKSIQLESPMSVTSDHFNVSAEQSIEDEEKSKSTLSESSIDEESFKAFEEAIEKNLNSFMGLELNNISGLISFKEHYEDISIMDTMALSQFLQMSLTIPLNSYMEILSNETLKMYILDLDILSHFKSLRNYFLMMNGEFCSSICHEIFSKLDKGVRPVELLNYQSLHMILDNALSSSRYDSNTERLSFIVQNSPERFELHSPGVFNMLSLSYTLDWPLTLILNAETMDQYRTIFCYLLKLKRISWILEDCFQILKESHKQHSNDIIKSPQYRKTQFIRHQMTQFVNCLENYVTRNVMQTSWKSFVEDLRSAKSILCIYRKHTTFLKRILFLCLLNKKSFEFYKSIEDVFKVILRFHKHLKAKPWQKVDAVFVHGKFERIETDLEDFNRLIKYIMYLGNKIIQHNYQKEIYDLLSMIDINGYYSNLAL